MSECKACDANQKLFKHPLVQQLLDQLPRPVISTPITINFPIAKSFKDKGRFIIAGYASVEVIDSQNEFIPLPVIKEAWDRFRKSGFNQGSLMHSNIPVIQVLDDYKDSEGKLWKSGVDKTGLFIVAEVRADIEKGVQTRQLIEDGKLTGYSIGGEALASTVVCEGKCYTRIDKMDLHEIAVVDRPANQPSVFTIVKSEALKKLAELTDILPNMIISQGVAKLAGSTAELGKGHDFDVLIQAKEGSFVDRAIQTRIYNELRAKGREDLWKTIHIIHEPEGLGPFTKFVPLYDLVLLRSNSEPIEMKVEEGEVKLEKADNRDKRLKDEFNLNDGQIKLLHAFLGNKVYRVLEDKVTKAEGLSADDIRKKIISLLQQRKALSEKLWGKPTPAPEISAEEKESAMLELDVLDADITAWKSALGEVLVEGSVSKITKAVELIQVESILGPAIYKLEKSLSKLPDKGTITSLR